MRHQTLLPAWTMRSSQEQGMYHSQTSHLYAQETADRNNIQLHFSRQLSNFAALSKLHTAPQISSNPLNRTTERDQLKYKNRKPTPPLKSRPPGAWIWSVPCERTRVPSTAERSPRRSSRSTGDGEQGMKSEGGRARVIAQPRVGPPAVDATPQIDG
jgi:hypothetical protein